VNASLDHCWLFVCLFFTNKQELLAPTFPHLSTTCSHCNSSSHLSINKASGLSPSLACQLHHLGPVGGEDLPVGIVFRTCPQDFLSPLSIGGVNWIPRAVFAKSTDSRITGPAPQPITWISLLGRKAHDSVDSLIGWAGVLGWSWPVSRGACPGGSGGSTVSTSQDTPFTLFLQLYLPAEDRWSWASTCRLPSCRCRCSSHPLGRCLALCPGSGDPTHRRTCWLQLLLLTWVVNSRSSNSSSKAALGWHRWPQQQPVQAPPTPTAVCQIAPPTYWLIPSWEVPVRVGDLSSSRAFHRLSLTLDSRSGAVVTVSLNMLLLPTFCNHSPGISLFKLFDMVSN